MESLDKTLAGIETVSTGLMEKARKHMNNLTKPRGSLGYLEELACRLFAIGKGKTRVGIDPGRIYTCAADHGVVSAGVSLFPQEVTRQMVFNFLQGGAAINVLTNCCDVQLRVVDAGCSGEPFPPDEKLVDARIRPGTADISEGPAMSLQECGLALEKGIKLAEQAKKEGCRCLGTGDMGIANTTPSTALFCAFLGFDPQDVTGPGTGLDENSVRRKVRTVERALEVNSKRLKSEDPLQVLAAVGGLEIACLSGIVLGGAKEGIPVVIDGFISTAAFVGAWMLSSRVLDYCFFAHASAEPGYGQIMERIGARPIHSLDMRLGEGTGAAMGMHVLRCASDVFNDMATFENAGISE